MILPENEFNHLKGVNKQPYCGHQHLSITFDQLMFLFLFSTAVARTTLPWSIGLLFLLDNIFYIHPIGHVWVVFWPLCQNESKCKTIHMTSTYRFINWFLCEIFARRLVLKQRQKETFIHELLTGAFDLYLLRAASPKYQLDLEIAKKSDFSKLAQNAALWALVTKILF